MVAGTNKPRTMVASSPTARAMPSPSAFTETMPARVNDAAMTTMMAAMLVMIPPVRARPRATASVLSPLAAYSSRIRLKRKIS